MMMMSWSVAMASAGPAQTRRTSTVHIPEFVVNGDKFLKWDDVSYVLFVIHISSVHCI